MHACKSDAAFWQPVTVCMQFAAACCSLLLHCALLRLFACGLLVLFVATCHGQLLAPCRRYSQLLLLLPVAACRCLACSLFLSACSPLLLAVCCGCCCNLLRPLLQPAGATCLQHAVLSAACCRGCCMWPADADCSQPVMLFVQRDVLRCSLLLLPHAATCRCSACRALWLLQPVAAVQPAAAGAVCWCCCLQPVVLVTAACHRSVRNLLLLMSACRLCCSCMQLLADACSQCCVAAWRLPACRLLMLSVYSC